MRTKAYVSSFATIIHPPDGWDISTSWVINMCVAQVCFSSVTIKDHSNRFIRQHNATDIVLRELTIGMLAAGMSTRTVAHEFSVHLKLSLAELFHLPHNCRRRLTTPAQDPCIWLNDGLMQQMPQLFCKNRWCQCYEQSAPWWWWDYGLGRQTVNTGAFY